MVDALAKLFNDFDRGTMTRRQLFQALGIAAVAAPLTSALGQGRCGGARAGTAVCDTMPARLPFEPTGWHTVLLDHFSMQATDYEKEAAYYAALMGWKVRRLWQRRHSRRLPTAASAAAAPDGQPRSPSRRVGWILLGHRAVGCQEGGIGVEKARPQSRRGQ
jgi:hypothetical protein